MPKILDSVVSSLPSQLSKDEALIGEIRQLQADMRDGALLRPLDPTGLNVNAEGWNAHLAEFAGQTWHDAPWWVVENYMYKRLLEAFARRGPEAACQDPFEPQKNEAIASVAGVPLTTSIEPLLKLIASAEGSSAEAGDKRTCLQAALLRSLWGNQADLSLSAGKVEEMKAAGEIISDNVELALDLLMSSPGQIVAMVLDNHGIEVVCDLVLADALLRLAGASAVTLHVKNAPVFVSDVTKADVFGVIVWLREHSEALGTRLAGYMEEGRLLLFSDEFYTSARPFWQIPQVLHEEFACAAAVILKGDANFRRLLGDLHWPHDTNFDSYGRGFWPSAGLIALRTMKSGVAIGITAERKAQALAARPADWLTSGHYGQVLVSWRS